MELPNEIWVIILRKLDVFDRIRCRLVSKHFKILIDQFCQTELLMYYHENIYHRGLL